MRFLILNLLALIFFLLFVIFLKVIQANLPTDLFLAFMFGMIVASFIWHWCHKMDHGYWLIPDNTLPAAAPDDGEAERAKSSKRANS